MPDTLSNQAREAPELCIRAERSQISRVAPYILIESYRRLRRQGWQEFLCNEIRQQVDDIPDIERLFPGAAVRKHYVYEPIRDTVDHPDLYITQLRYFRMWQYFQAYWPDVISSESMIADVGDTSGILFQALGKPGTSVNINQECVDFVRAKGLDAVKADAERLDFPDGSFDYVFCFQMLEHVPNPIAVLRELGRIARRAVFLSIPYRRSTQIYDLAYWIDQKKTSWHEEEVRDVDCHVFEFSTADFVRILSHTPLKYETNFPIAYFSEDTIMRRLLNRRIDSYFNFFVLRPRGQGSE